MTERTRGERLIQWWKRLIQWLAATQRWLPALVVTAAVILALYGLVWLFEASPAEWEPWKGNLARLKTVAQVVTPIVLLFGLYVALRRVKVADKQAETAAKQAETAADGLVTERFGRAVEQLGKEESLTVRLGGIYALERIALKSPSESLDGDGGLVLVRARTPPSAQL